ncbi:MAG: long-chain fatty acid--CoA ligase [Pseudomonas sp.]|nr:MAG: long-chain fatty acid--CoA ligase [Pseudomonas sp.]
MSSSSLNLAARLVPHEPLVMTARGSWSGEELLAATAHPSLQTALAFPAVALWFHDPLKLALSLIALDGLTKRLLLIPAEAPTQAIAALLTSFGGHMLLTDEPFYDGADGRQILWPELVSLPKTGQRPPLSEQGKTEWIFTTSGTTGAPKLVAHSLGSLSRTIRTAGSSLCWGQTSDAARFAGMQVFLHAVLGGGSIVMPPFGTKLSDRLAFFHKHRCNAISATPTLWRKIVMTPGHEQLNLIQITLGGEIADEAILRELKRCYPQARITHVYASTEAGAAFSVQDGQAGFPLRFLNQDQGGVDVKVVEGRLFVRTREGALNYVNSDAIFSDTDGFVDTGDLVQVTENRCLFIGRVNGSINIGGNKLHPQQVETILLSLPEVAAARVFSKANAITGQIIVAEIVPKNLDTDANLLKRRMREACLAGLERWQVPGIIKIVPELDVNSSHKLSRSY